MSRAILISYAQCYINASVIGKSFAGARPDFSNRLRATFSMTRVGLERSARLASLSFWFDSGLYVGLF